MVRRNVQKNIWPGNCFPAPEMLESTAGFLYPLEKWRQMWGEVQDPAIINLPGLLMRHGRVQVAGYWSRQPVQNVWVTLQSPHCHKQVCSSGISWKNSSRITFRAGTRGSAALTDESCEGILWLVKYHVILISPAILYPFSWYLVFIIFTVELSFTFLLSPCFPVRWINPCSGEKTPAELCRIFPVVA